MVHSSTLEHTHVDDFSMTRHIHTITDGLSMDRDCQTLCRFESNVVFAANAGKPSRYSRASHEVLLPS